MSESTVAVVTPTGRAGALPFAVGTLLLAAACSGTADRVGAEQTVARDSAGLVVVENFPSAATPVCDVAPNPALVIGAQEGAPEYQFHRTFGARRLSDGRIAVVNQGSQELRFYDAEGNFLSASGRAGEGPGEFRNAFTLTVMPGDTLWVGDFTPWEWEVFAPDGTWVRAVRPEPSLINRDVSNVLDDGRMIISEYNREHLEAPGFNPRRMTLTLHAPDGSLVDTLVTLESNREGQFEDTPYFISSPMFDASARAVAGGTRLVTGHTSRPELTINEVGDALRPIRLVRWKADPVEVTPAHVEAERARISEPFASLSERERRELLYPQIREDRPVAEAFPFISSVVLGRDGRIWVRTYRPPPASETREWLVFDADGALQCRVEVFAFEQMPEFGSDYILVMKRDELGIERIFLHELSAPRPAGEDV